MESSEFPSRGALILALLVAAGSAYWEWTVTGQQRQKIAELEAVAAKAAEEASKQRALQGPSMEIQRKCAEDARKWWDDAGWKPNDRANYVNHYSMRLNRCFIDMQSTSVDKDAFSTSRQILDVLENKEYGSYLTYNAGDKKYWEVKPLECEVRMENGDMVKCETDKQFSDMIRAFMEG